MASVVGMASVQGVGLSAPIEGHAAVEENEHIGPCPLAEGIAHVKYRARRTLARFDKQQRHAERDSSDDIDGGADHENAGDDPDYVGDITGLLKAHLSGHTQYCIVTDT